MSATTGLDPQARSQVGESLRALTKERTTLSITHDVTQALSADRVLWLEDGRIVEDGTPAELVDRADSRVHAWIRQASDEGAVATTGGRP